MKKVHAIYSRWFCGCNSAQSIVYLFLWMKRQVPDYGLFQHHYCFWHISRSQIETNSRAFSESAWSTTFCKNKYRVQIYFKSPLNRCSFFYSLSFKQSLLFDTHFVLSRFSEQCSVTDKQVF